MASPTIPEGFTLVEEPPVKAPAVPPDMLPPGFTVVQPDGEVAPPPPGQENQDIC